MCCHLGWKQVGAWIEELPSWSGKVESGQDWETVVLAFDAMRPSTASLTSCWDCQKGLYGPPRCMWRRCRRRMLPNQQTVMLAWWKGQRIRTYPYIAVLSPTFSKTEIVDAVWIYQESATASCLARGMQAKLGSAYPKQDMPLGMLGLLFRGKAPETSGNPKRQRWNNVAAGDIESFLGTSLTAAYPENWPNLTR